MPNNLTDPVENQLIDALHGTAAFTAPVTPLKLRLMTANGTDAAAGTEVTGGTYAPQNIAFTAAAAGSSSNTALIRFDGLPAATIVGVEVWDSTATTPRRLWHSPLAANVTVAAGQPLEFGAGAITFALD